MTAVVTRSTTLDAPAVRVWAAVKTPAAFTLVTRGLITLPAVRGRAGEWRAGETVTSWLLLFGVVPFSRHHLTIVEIDDAHRVMRSDEHGGLIRSWRHDITVTPLDGVSCRYEDRIEIDAGMFTRPVVWYATAFYAMRQHRWRRLAPALGTGSA